ncbi:MAG TPA: hypothetical protein VEK15_30995 [Vicinamibacteria bacterium]|nr:hypothetical protein [Vicinamibacteria bacterium]
MAQSLVRTLKRVLVLASVTMLAGCGDDLSLPALPAFANLNAVSEELFRAADARARESPSAESFGSLGMLYHAYRFLEEGRVCYELARRSDPGDFRWIYYGAMLEKTGYRYEASETLFIRALEMRPDDAELLAELGDLYLMWARPGDARESLERSLRLDPLQPVAALGKARLAMLEEKWSEILAILLPLLDRFPRLSRGHQFLAAAYGALGDEEKQETHRVAGEYGSAVESPLMRDLHELAVPAILNGDASAGPELLKTKCARCHDQERIIERDADRLFWARTVRRMQREAGWPWLTDDEAAALVAFLSTRAGESR